jgi:hypothetical protein
MMLLRPTNLTLKGNYYYYNDGKILSDSSLKKKHSIANIHYKSKETYESSFISFPS